MKFSQLLFLGSVATPGLALVPAARYQALGSPDAGTDSAFSARGRDVPGGALRVRAGIQYDNYLPELPAGWPNMTAVKQGTSGGTESRDVAIRPRGDVAIRDDPGDFARYLFMGLKVFSVANAAVNWYSLEGSCSQFTQEVGNGIQCVFGAISQVIAVATLVYQGAVWRGQLATALTNNGWHVPGINKRDEWASIMARDLSDGLKTEVRHLGTWDGIEPNRKRDSGPAVPREMFGVQSGGHDFHFTYLGRDAEGKDSFKLGLGDGSGASNGQERRTTVTDSNFYFTSGGIDFAAQSVESISSTEWTWVSPTDNVEFGDIYGSVSCYLDPFFGITFGLENAINFQIYDGYQDYTLSAGVMSPFSASKESAIRSLSITGGIGNNSCARF